jgi:hypothetical protein
VWEIEANRGGSDVEVTERRGYFCLVGNTIKTIEARRFSWTVKPKVEKFNLRRLNAKQQKLMSFETKITSFKVRLRL